MSQEITDVLPRSAEIEAEIRRIDILVLIRIIDLTTVIETAVRGCLLGVRVQKAGRKLNGKPVTITEESSAQVVRDLVRIPDFQNLLSQLGDAPALAALFCFENGVIIPLPQIKARMIWLRGAIRQAVDGRRFFQPDGSYRVE